MHSLQALALSAGLLVLADTARCQLTFPPSATIGLPSEPNEPDLADPGVMNLAVDIGVPMRSLDPEAVGPDQPPPVIQRQDLITVGPFVRICPCTNVNSADLVVDDIRDISDTYVADGNQKSMAGLSNMVWGFGQFLDHDLSLTIEDEGSPTFPVGTVDPDDDMDVHRAVTTSRDGCRNNLNVHTNAIDAGPIYGSDRIFLQLTLREPGTCFMRTSGGNFVPITSVADDEGRFFLVAGDVRVSEHAFLAAQHIVWVREHNRLCEVVNASPQYDNLGADRKFNLVQNVVTAKFQQVVLTEFLPALGISQQDLEDATPLTNRDSVSVEFSIAYRLGHDLIGNTVGTIPVAGSFSTETFFLDNSGSGSRPSVAYKDDADAMVRNIMQQLSTSSANEIDGKLSDALRNMLFDLGEDLAGRNIFRGRDLGLPTYAGLAECYGTTPNAQIEAETPDAWLGLLREPKAPGEPLPPTLRAIIVEQFHRSFFGRRNVFWRNTAGSIRDFVEEIENSTYAEIISRNTGADVTGNVFKTT